MDREYTTDRHLPAAEQSHKTIIVGSERIRVPADLTPAEEDRIRRDIHQRQMEERLERITPQKARKKSQEKSEEMSQDAIGETLEFFFGAGVLLFVVGVIAGALYGLVEIFFLYGVLGLIAAAIVGGGFISVSSLALSVWRNRT